MSRGIMASLPKLSPHRVLLGVAVAGAGDRVPHDALVEHVLAARIDDRADQDRHLDGGHRGLDAALRLRVAEGVDGRGVLGPEHEVGTGRRARGHLAGEVDGGLHVVVGDLAEVEQDVGAVAGHVTLHGRDLQRAVGARRPRTPRGGEEDGPDSDGAHRGETASLTAQQQVGEEGAEQRQEQADAGRPDVRQGRCGGRVDDGEGEPPPRHAAERPPAAQRLDGLPGQRRPERPCGQAPQQGHDGAQQAQERRLEAGEGQPGVGVDGPHPPHQDVGEAHAEGQPGQPGLPRPQVGGQHEERGQRRRHQPAGADRREGGAERHPGQQAEQRP
jgi:hypothetical protein